MRALMNTSTIVQFAWSNGRTALRAAFPRQTCGCAFIMQVPGESSKPKQIHRKGRNA